MNTLVVLFAVVAVAVAQPVKRSIGHTVYTLPSAVSHQSRVDVHSSPVVTSLVAEPVVETVVPAVYAAPAAVSHQSRVDVRSSPSFVATAPYVAAPVVEARSVYAPVATTYVGGSAVSHQSRLDVETSPAVVQQHVVPAVFEARSAWAPSVYATAW